MTIRHRQAERLYPASQEVHWGAPGAPLSRAALRDHSQSGAGIALPSDLDIRLGELIRVMFNASPAPRYARIVRIERAFNEELHPFTLGCRWVTGNRHRRGRHAAHPRTIRGRRQSQSFRTWSH